MSRSAFRGLWTALASGLALTLLAPDAAAFVRSRTTQGCNPVHWDQTCLHIAIDSHDVPGMPPAEAERITGLALGAWQEATSSRSFLTFVYVGATTRETVLDGWGVIKVRGQSWCRPAEEAGGLTVCYDPSAIALTTLSYETDPAHPDVDGRIVDADIELNAVTNLFVDLDTFAPASPNPDRRKVVDLWNTLTHELGHLQGLEHTCRLGAADGIPSCTRDSAGEPLVDCQLVAAGHSTDPALLARYQASMYPAADDHETRKRLPMADDVAGIVAAYPVAADPATCAVPGTSGAEPAAPASPSSATTDGRAIAPQAGCSLSAGREHDCALLCVLGACAAVGLRRRKRE